MSKTKDYIKRYFGYMFWAGCETLIAGGVPKLVIFPLVAYILGKEQFGIFLYALGLVMIIGYAPSKGLSAGLIRNMVGFASEAKERLISTSVKMLRIAMLAIVSIYLLVVVALYFIGLIDYRVAWCMALLLLLLYSWNLFEIQMTRYRVERRFAFRTGWYAILVGFMFLIVPGAILGGVLGVAIGYGLSYTIVLIVLSFKQGYLFKRLDYNREQGKLLKTIWFHMTVADILGLSSRYIYRIILGSFHGYSEVSILFGATNIIELCMAPIGMLGMLLLSMLGGFERLKDVGNIQRYTVLVSVFLLVAGATVMVSVAGPLILSIMFPEFAGESSKILNSIILVIPFSAIVLFSRPFIVKFGPVKFIPALNFITLAANLTPALLFIPKSGIKGAVISYNIGYGLSAVVWLMALIWTFKFYHDRMPDTPVKN